MVDDIGFFGKMGLESEALALAQFVSWKAHAESLKRCDKLLKEPEHYEIENFFDANNITDFGTAVTQMKYAHNASLSAQVCTSDG